LSPVGYSATLFTEKARRANFGLKTELPQISGSPNTLLPFYYMLPVFARPEACPPCCYVLFDVDGVIFFSMSVGVVGEDRSTAAKNAGLPENVIIIAKPKEDTARPQRVKRPIGKPKTAAVMVKVKKGKETWMMQLQHLDNHGL
jgi:hypothetical protein